MLSVYNAKLRQILKIYDFELVRTKYLLFSRSFIF